MAPNKRCTCTYANAKNTPSVASGHSMGGYVLEECAYCKEQQRRFEAKEEAYKQQAKAPLGVATRTIDGLVCKLPVQAQRYFVQGLRNYLDHKYAHLPNDDE